MKQYLFNDISRPLSSNRLVKIGHQNNSIKYFVYTRTYPIYILE